MDLYYKDQIISPHCIDEYDGNISSCMNDLEAHKIPENAELIEPYKTYYSYSSKIEDGFFVTNVCWFLSKKASSAKCSDHKMKYLGKLGEYMFILYQLTDGNNDYYSKILSLKLEGDKLIKKYLYSNENGYTINAYIKGNILYFEEDLNAQDLWGAILDGTRSSKDHNVEAPAMGKKSNKIGRAQYHLNEFHIDPEHPDRYLAPTVPDKITLLYNSPLIGGNGKPEIYENKYCSDEPFLDIYDEFVSNYKNILKTKKDFINFSSKVEKKCNEAIKRQSNKS